MPHLALATLHHSDNVGDGLIADCAEHLIKSLHPTQPLVRFDIAGRTAPAASTPNAKRLQQCILYALPALMRPLVVWVYWHLKLKSACAAVYQPALQNACGVVCVGGQMLSDLALNFPLKINLLGQLCARQNIPLAFNAVGVGTQWSWLGKKLFRQALVHARYISVRDEPSRKTLHRHLPALQPIHLTYDPALFAPQTYNLHAHPNSQTIGLGIAHPQELRHMADNPAAFTDAAITATWVNIYQTLSPHFPLTLFTNGAVEDEAFLTHLSHAIKIQTGQTPARLPRPTTPRMLVENITQCRALVAYRLHALITAFSLDIPSVGLVWDSKVRSFTQLTQRPFLEAQHFTTPGVMEALQSSLQNPPSPAAREKLQAHVKQEMQTLLKAFPCV